MSEKRITGFITLCGRPLNLALQMGIILDQKGWVSIPGARLWAYLVLWAVVQSPASTSVRIPIRRSCPMVCICPSYPPSWNALLPICGALFGFSINTALLVSDFSCLATFMGELAFHPLIWLTPWSIAHTTESFNWIYICFDSTCQCGMNLHQTRSSFAEFICNPTLKGLFPL